MRVYLRRCGELEEDVRWVFERLGWRRVVSPEDTVLVKPNFCGELGRGVTTHLELLRCVVEVLQERARVLVGETESPYKNLERIFRRLELPCEVVNLSKVPGRRFERRYGVLELPELAFEAKIVNMPVMKTHVLTGMTLGIKNLFGLVQVPGKARYHHCIDEVLLDVLELVRHRVVMNLLDGVYVMDGAGPMDGRVLPGGFIMGSRDVVALDVCACRVAGVEPRSVPHVRRAMEMLESEPELDGDAPPGLRLRVPEQGVHRWIARAQRFEILRMLMDSKPVRLAGSRLLKMMGK